MQVFDQIDFATQISSYLSEIKWYYLNIKLNYYNSNLINILRLLC